jgi:hypothetical protein
VVVGRQVAILLAQLTRPAELRLDQMKPGEALERLTALLRRPHLLRQREGPGVGLAHGRHRVPLRGHQARPQTQQEREFVLRARGALGEGRQHRQPFREGGDGFVRGMALDGIVGRLLERVDGPLALAPALEVQGQLGRNVSGTGAIPCRQAGPRLAAQLGPPRRPPATPWRAVPL